MTSRETGCVPSEAPELERRSSLPGDKLRRLGKVAFTEAVWVVPAVIIGAGAGFGIWNGAKGSDYQVGPATVNSKFTWGSDATLRYGADILRADIDTPLNTGITIEVRQVDSEQMRSVEGLLAETGVTGDPTAILERITENTAHDAGKAAALGGLALGGSVVAVRRRPRGPQKRAATMTAAGLVAVGGMAGSAPSLELHSYDWQKVGQVFDGNSFDTFSVTGPTSSGIVSSLQKNEVYYNKISDNVRHALVPIAEEDRAARRQGIYIDSDWHCNFGMARVTETTIKTLGINTVVSLGDVVPSGASYETPCIDVYAQRTNAARTRFVAPGNHDSTETIDYMADRGFQVLKGQIVEVEGLKIYGDSDPVRTPFGAGQQLRRPEETPVAFSERIARDTARTNPDMLFIHNPEYTPAAALSAALTVNGHRHVRSEPDLVDQDSLRMTIGTVGGASENSWTLTGRLGTAAEQTIVYYEKRAGKSVLTGFRTITVHPNTKVEVSPFRDVLPERAEKNQGAVFPDHSASAG